METFTALKLLHGVSTLLLFVCAIALLVVAMLRRLSVQHRASILMWAMRAFTTPPSHLAQQCDMDSHVTRVRQWLLQHPV